MQPDLNLKSFQVEVSLPNFLVRGHIVPRGDFVFFLNDSTHVYFRFDQAELIPLSPEYQVPGIQQESMSVNREYVSFISILDREDLDNLQYIRSERPVVFYTEWFAIRGNLHVNDEAHDDDLLDSTHDFFVVTDASIFPLRSLKIPPQRRVPFVAINRHLICAYHPYRSKADESS
jgi:hypothetical protein